MTDRTPAEIFNTPVAGRLLGGPTLADQLDADLPTLLVFLRHFG